MKHFKIVLETGKKKSSSRVMYVKASDIIDALTISKKVRGGRLTSINPITYAEYMTGVDKKYDHKHTNVY